LTAVTITIDPSADLPAAEVYTIVHEELGVWPRLSGTTRSGIPDLVVYVSMALSAFGGAVADEVAAQSVDGLKRMITRLMDRPQPGPDRILRTTDETTGVVFVLDSPQARSTEALRAMVRPDGWTYARGTELRWDPDARIWRPGAPTEFPLTNPVD
jgi:hypothetical protein